MEILSPSETPRSIREKIEDYCEIGVQECWIVSPEAETVEVRRLTPEGMETVATYAYSQTLQRFDPRYAAARQAIVEGRIGEPIHAFARRNNILTSGRRLQGRTSVLFFLGIHDVDFLLWCFDARPQKVYAAANRKLMADLDVDDCCFLLLHFERGEVACVETSWVLPNSSLASLDARLEIVGTRGAVYVDIHGQGLTVVEESRLDRPDTMYGPVVHGQVSGILKEEIAHFVSCVLEDRGPLITGEMGLDAVRVIVAAHRSLQTGQPELI